MGTKENLPQGLKPRFFSAGYGTAEAEPFKTKLALRTPAWFAQKENGAFSIVPKAPLSGRSKLWIT